MNNLRNIQFIRMIFKDFDERVTFRFAQFDLTRNSWRKYRTQALCDNDITQQRSLFDVDAVNIEENGQRTPFNYVLPEGITRENIPGQFSNFFQNEQSLSLRTCDLVDGCARAIYKNINFDMRLYERLKMFVHAETFDNRALLDGEASLIVRLGTDFQDNFYEYEIPLYLSDPLIGDSPSEIVWRPENELDVAFSLFVETKKERNAAGFPTNRKYTKLDPESDLPKYVSVIGNPNLGQVRSVMIGIKNPELDTTIIGDPICAEVWVNELRMTGLDERGGVAGLARLSVQLADFADLGAALNYSSIGFGAIDQKLLDRSQQEDFSYDVSGTFQLDKFLPQKWGIRLPMFAQLSSESSTPRFDPNDRDLDLKEKIRTAPDQFTKDSIRDATINKTTIKSLNFTNVRKERTGKGKPMPWDISNFSATYAFTETDKRDPIIKSDKSTRQRAALDYSFSTRSKFIQPFKNLSKSKLLKPLTEFNFNPIPNNFSFSTELNRIQGVRQYRFAPADEIWRDNRFTWDRRYGFQWDFSKSLRFNYQANNQAIVDEIGFDYEDLAPGEFINPLDQSELINRQDFDSRSKSFRNENLRNFGRPKNYQQSVTVTYDLPLKHFPLLDFATMKAKYTGTYNWAGAALNVDSLGNIISNNQRRELTADLNFEKLYEKVPYLKKINKKKRPNNAKKSRNSKDTPNRDPRKIDPNGSTPRESKKKDKKEREPGGLERALLRPLMAIRKARLTYEENFSTVVPGFKLRPKYFGLSEDFSAPGTGFVFGLQPDDQWFDDIKNRENDWITNSRFLNQEVFQTHSTTAGAKITVEPFKDFRIEVNGNYDFSEDNSRYFKNVSPLSTGFNDDINVDFREENFRRFGSYNITFMAIRTLFKDGLDNVEALFTQFEDNRTIISQNLGVGEHGIDGSQFTEGFGRTQQDVLVPAFLSAYTGRDINSYDNDWNIFKEFPRPNWQLTYNGLNKLPWFKDIFQTFNLTHGYKSRLQVNNYITDRDWNANDLFKLNDITANYFTELEIPAIVITEEFSPLLGLSIKTKNDMTLDLNLRKQRSLTMSFTNNELREMRSSEYTASFGYTLKNVYLGFLPGMEKRNKRKRVPRNTPPGTVNTQNQDGKGRDLIMKFDFSLRDDLSLNHLLDENTRPIPTRGVRSIRFSPSLDYEASESLILSLFFDYSKTTPYVSTSYPITNARGGLQVRILFN
ncbi:MAG: cell surface protein SprA [Bacteroidota bacterium]